MVMQGNNNYTGVTTVSAGAISIRNGNALGAGANNTVVSNGAALFIVGSGFLIPETIQIDGTGIGGNGVIWIPSTSGATTLSGAITTNTVAASRINNDGTGLLTIGTAAFTNNGGITFGLNSTGGVTVTSVIGGTSSTLSNLTKDGTGTGMLILSGANTYAGTTTITTGVLQVTNGTALGNTTGATSIASGAALEINGTLSIAEAMTINGTGLAATPGVIRLISGSGAPTLSGAITAATASRINNDGTGLLTIGTAAFTNTGGISFGLNSTGGITVSSVISAAGGVTKDGTGTGRLILGGANIYTGLTTISTGVIQITNSDGLGSVSAGGAGSSNTIVSDGAALEINVASGTIVPETLNIYGLGFVETNANGAIRMISVS
ncbi:MAG: beta strand repeat-containing protein, partial [Dolichospermum sp.]